MTACGVYKGVPDQRLVLRTDSPADYKIRVQKNEKESIDTAVPPDGRITFAVPVKSRASVVYLLGWVPVYRYPLPDTLEIIYVMQGNDLVRKLSAKQITRLPTDEEGYYILKINR